MATTTAKERKDLLRAKRDIEKQLNNLKNEAKIDKALEDWKELDDLRNELHAICGKRGTSLQKVMNTPAYYLYASVDGNKKSTNKEAKWVQDAIKRGTSEERMLQRAEQLRRKYVASKIKKRSKKKPVNLGDFMTGGKAVRDAKNKASRQQGTL